MPRRKGTVRKQIRMTPHGRDEVPARAETNSSRLGATSVSPTATRERAPGAAQVASQEAAHEAAQKAARGVARQALRETEEKEVAHGWRTAIQP